MGQSEEAYKLWNRIRTKLNIVPRLMNHPADTVAGSYNRLDTIEPVPVDSASYCFVSLVYIRHAKATHLIEQSIRGDGRLSIPVEHSWSEMDDTVYVLYTPRDPATDAPLGETAGLALMRKLKVA